MKIDSYVRGERHCLNLARSVGFLESVKVTKAFLKKPPSLVLIAQPIQRMGWSSGLADRCSLSSRPPPALSPHPHGLTVLMAASAFRFQSASGESAERHVPLAITNETHSHLNGISLQISGTDHLGSIGSAHRA